jgi:ribokinase
MARRSWRRCKKVDAETVILSASEGSFAQESQPAERSLATLRMTHRQILTLSCRGSCVAASLRVGDGADRGFNGGVKAAKRIVVIGSANMDLVCRTPRIPAPGETILGENLITIPGGKGANQAVAAAKLAESDTDVYLIARVGDDDFGQRLLNGLSGHHVRTEHVTVTEGVSSGCAMILVDRKGENSIVVAPGANAKLTVADVDRAKSLITGATVVLVQLEIPMETVRHAIALAREAGVFTILDPAPAPPRGLPREMLDVDLLSPNQGEAELLLGRTRTHRVTTKRLSDPKLIAGELLTRGARAVALKLGHKGALFAARSGEIERVRPYKVSIRDTTAAGDAFSGALAVGRCEGMDWRAMVRFANAAGAACCGEFGAQPALPTREQVMLLMNRKAPARGA